MADNALVRLASVTRVERHKRRSKLGNTVQVDSYLRKVHDAINSMGGPTVAAKQGINMQKLQQDAAKADKGTISKKEFEANLRTELDKRNSPAPEKTAAPSKPEAKTPEQAETPETSELPEAPQEPAGEPAGEPSLPEGFEKVRDPRTGREIVQMTPEQHSKHLAEVKQRVDDAIAQGKATDVEHKVTAPNGQMVWTREREKVHAEIIRDLMEQAKERGVGQNRRAVMSGGLGGSGKTTTLNSGSGINTNEYIVLNPDDMKEELVNRGLAPQIEGVQPMEGAGLIHEESSDLALGLARAAQDAGYDVMWDITMASESSVQKRIDMLKKDGYEIEAVFVDIPIEQSVERALARHERGATQFIVDGKGPGGRFVDPKHIRANKPTDNRFNSNNRTVFEKLKTQFSNWQLYDNSGAAPKKVDEAPAGARSKRSDGYYWIKQGDGTWVRDTSGNTPALSLSAVDRLRTLLTLSN